MEDATVEAPFLAEGNLPHPAMPQKPTAGKQLTSRMQQESASSAVPLVLLGVWQAEMPSRQFHPPVHVNVQFYLNAIYTVYSLLHLYPRHHHCSG